MTHRMILIAPPDALKEIPRRESHLLLPDLMHDRTGMYTKATDAYEHYYRTNNFTGRIILDNGAFEGTPYPREILLRDAAGAHCTHIVLPDDTTGGDPHPLDTFLEHLKLYPSTYRYIYVIHGRTPEKLASRAMEAIRYRIEHPLVDFDLAISSLALRFNSDSMEPILDRCYVRPRALMILKEIYETHPQTRGTKLGWVHLLGAVSYTEMENCVNILTTISDEVSFDTCDPMKEATTWSTRNPHQWGSRTEVIRNLVKFLEKWDRL